jgi:hypothetical protein
MAVAAWQQAAQKGAKTGICVRVVSQSFQVSEVACRNQIEAKKEREMSQAAIQRT